MKKVPIMILLATLLIIVSACSNAEDNKIDESNTSSPKDKQEDNNENSDDTSSADNNKQDNEDETLSNDPEEEQDQTTTINESDDSTVEFDVESYLNENYAIENTHYVTDSWKNEETGRTDVTVKILPDTKEFGQEINNVFQNGITYEDERTQSMFEMAEQIMNDIPQINNRLHIDSVNWVSTIDDFTVMLIQDYENSDLHVGDKEDEENLTQYSSKQIEYARVWLQLGPNQDITELYVRHIPAGTPLNPGDDIDVSYPEDVIQLTGSRLVDGIVTYSGNGNGTINVYNVPRRWYGGSPPPEDIDKEAVREDMEDIVKNTKLVYVDPGDDAEIIKLIKLLNVDN
jgi:hypothetical protein